MAILDDTAVERYKVAVLESRRVIRLDLTFRDLSFVVRCTLDS